MKTLHSSILLAALAVALSPAQAAGQDGHFDGFSVGLAAGIAHHQSDFLWTGTYNSGIQWFDAVDGLSKSGAAGRLSAGYGFDPLPGMHLGVSAFADFGKRDIGAYGYGEDSQPPYGYVVSMKLDRVRGLAIEPGWALGERTLGYLRLGVTYGKVKVMSAGVEDGGSYVDNGEVSVRGTALGWGVKHALTRQWSVGVEVTHTRFGEENLTLSNGTEQLMIKPRQTQGLVTLGYRF